MGFLPAWGEIWVFFSGWEVWQEFGVPTYTGGFGFFIGILGFCGDEGLGGWGSHLMCGFGIFSGIEV